MGVKNGLHSTTNTTTDGTCTRSSVGQNSTLTEKHQPMYAGRDHFRTLMMSSRKRMNQCTGFMFIPVIPGVYTQELRYRPWIKTVRGIQNKDSTKKKTGAYLDTEWVWLADKQLLSAGIRFPGDQCWVGTQNNSWTRVYSHGSESLRLSLVREVL